MARSAVAKWRKAVPGAVKQHGGLVGAVAGVVAAGIGAGIALERVVVGRAKSGSDEEEPLGSWRGVPTVVKTEDDLELYVEVDEPENPRYSATVVFCHAYAVNMDEWYFQRRALAEEVRVVAYDHRSHGRSGRADPASCTIEQLGRDLLAVLEEVVPAGPVVLVGHSMGGMTIMALAEEHPELFGDRVTGVALVGTSPGGLSDVTLGFPGPLGKVVNRVTPTFVAALSRAPDLVEHGRKAGSDIGYLITRHYSFGSKVPASRVEFVVEMLAGTPIDVVADFFPTFSEHDRADALAALHRVETLVVGADKDLVTPVEHSRRLSLILPRADYLELADCGHMMQVEYPDQVNERLRRLLRRVEDRRDMPRNRR